MIDTPASYPSSQTASLGLAEVEPQAVPLLLLGPVAARAHHLGHPRRRHDPPGEQRLPEGVQVGRRGVDAAVADTDARAGGGRCCAGRRRRGSGEPPAPAARRSGGTPCRPGRRARRRGVRTRSWYGVPLARSARIASSDVAAVVVGEPLARRGDGRVPVEDRQVALGRRQRVHRHRQHVVGDVVDRRPRRGSRRCPRCAPAGARPSRRQRPAGGRRRAAIAPSSRGRGRRPRPGSSPPAR